MCGTIGAIGTSDAVNKVRIANPIAQRRLAVVDEPARKVVITLGKPRPEPDPSVWMCSYLVEGIPDERRRVAHGADSLQALQMAIEGARTDIKESGVVCAWGDSEPGDVGLPRSVPDFEGSGFAEKIERYIDRELARFGRAVKAGRFKKGDRWR